MLDEQNELRKQTVERLGLPLEKRREISKRRKDYQKAIERTDRETKLFTQIAERHKAGLPLKLRRTIKKEWTGTLEGLAQHGVNECAKRKFGGVKIRACKAMVSKYRYNGKHINENTLYRYMKGKKMGEIGE